MSRRIIRVLVADPGHDSHDPAIEVARRFSDAGMEVIYLGYCHGDGSPLTARSIAISAIQEGVDAVALSVLSDWPQTIFPRVKDILVENGVSRILLIGGGSVPEADLARLRRYPDVELLGPEGTIEQALERMQAWVERAGRFG